ncbi:hypothetical protein [Butyrivibrio fibrisolvens]|uniref:hypothetical protein n=1 Tax=Butyrivibrio fibrisolvens TaxID=831 RepID=UPI00041B93A6|nr:hypothetical protein [Butyrivibrio fibrisolvens]
MKSLIKCFKLLKYSGQMKSQVFFLVVITVTGFIIEFTSTTDSFDMIGGFYIIVAPATIGHMLMSLSMSGLVQSSVLKKKLQTVYPHVLSFPLMSLSLLLIIVHRAWLIQNGVKGLSDAENLVLQSSTVFSIGILMFLCLIYFAISFKFHIKAMIIFIGIVIPTMVILQNNTFGIMNILGGDFKQSVIITIILFVCGNLLSIILSNVFYKYSLSEYWIKRSLGRQ